MKHSMRHRKQALISVIIPVYNRVQFLEDAIDSVLNQQYPSVELIVVDDGSTDGKSTDIIKSYGSRLTYIYQDNAGLCAARNTGVAHSHGEFLAFLDSDDVWVAGKLLKQMAIFSAEPNTDVVFGHAVQFTDASSSDTDLSRVKNLNKAMPAELASAMLIKRKVFERTNGFEPTMSLIADIEWGIRLKNIHPKTVMLDDIVLQRRIHGGNMSMEHKHVKKSMLMHVLRTRIRRRVQNNIV